MKVSAAVSLILFSSLIAVATASYFPQSSLNVTLPQINTNGLSGSIGNVVSEIVAFFRDLFAALLGATTTTTTTTTSVASTTIHYTTSFIPTITTTMSTTVKTTSVQTTTSIPTTSIATTSVSTTSVQPSGAVLCHNDTFLRVNQTENCSPVSLLLIDVGVGNTRYEIANAIVDIYLNNQLEFSNESLLQNFTTPYQFNFSNGHIVQVQVYVAHWDQYPLYRYANISLTYR
ncbi:MAG: hypothetical protein LVQ95_03630 [Candidatus Micrarchaeales archaeon]|nr:hypothetical protein [Candidatus Micrarchaeales archaeon]